MRAINRRSGYRSVYDETTKRVTEASEFIDIRLLYCDGIGGIAIRGGRVRPSLLLGAVIASETGTALMIRLQHRQG
jgi:hypothetical protein